MIKRSRMSTSQIDNYLEEWASWWFHFQYSLGPQKSPLLRLLEPASMPVYGSRPLWTGIIYHDLVKLHQRLSTELSPQQFNVLLLMYGATDRQLQQAFVHLDYQRTQRTLRRLKEKARNIVKNLSECTV